MDDEKRSLDAKQYQNIKQKMSLIHLSVTFVLLTGLVFTDVSRLFWGWAEHIHPFVPAALAFYFLFISLYFLIVDFPFSLFTGFLLEKAFHLSNHTFSTWFVDFLKKSILSFVFSLLLLELLALLLLHKPQDWWWVAWMGYALISFGVGKIFPVWIVPLFYKYGPIANESIKQKIIQMASRYQMPIENVYSLNLSRTTKKANAAFMGIGATKRVVLSDTLLEKFNEDEIEVVVAHELGHAIHKDIYKQLIFGMIASFLFFLAGYHLFPMVAEKTGYQSVQDMAALPVLFLIFYVLGFILTPLQSAFSRKLEYAADAFSLQVFPKKEAFVSCMRKLAEVNLADPEPDPVYEWFFYDHPSISKRIARANVMEKD